MVYDTNVLIYAVDDRSEFHDACLKKVENARAGHVAAYLTWNICYEFLRVTTHPRVLSNPWSLNDGANFLTSLLDSPGFFLLRHTSRHISVLSQVARESPEVRGNRVHDMHTAVLMREHNIREICTLDGDFRQFPFLEIINPLE